MNLPQIDLSNLPDLDTLTGLFGSASLGTVGSDDRIVILMTYLYSISPQSGLV